MKWLFTGKPLEEYIGAPRRNNFGLIRLIAAFMVMETHSHLIAGNDAYNDGSFHISFLGLPSFFFLSGLLVTQSLHNSSSWKDFCRRRILRIYPGALFAILTTAFIIGPLVTTCSLKDYFSSPVLYQYLVSCSLIHVNFLLPGVFEHSALGTASVNASLWTIVLELKLYFGLLITSVLTIPGKKIGLLILISALIATKILAQNTSYSHLIMPYTTYGAQFCIGAACYTWKDKITLPGYWLVLLPVCILISLWCHIWILTAYFLIPALVLFTATHGTAWLQKITPTADLSYGIYLFGFPIQQLVTGYLHPTAPLSLFALSSIAVLPPAILSWYLVEKKALRLK